MQMDIALIECALGRAKLLGPYHSASSTFNDKRSPLDILIRFLAS